MDAGGDLYVADSGNHRIRKIAPDGIISTVAGNGKAGYGGDGMAAIHARLSDPEDVAVGTDGSIYIADRQNSRIRVVGPDGIISTFAGGTSGGPPGKLLGDGPVDQAFLQAPAAVAIDHQGNLLVAVVGDRQVRRVTPPLITTIAGVRPRAELVDNMPAMSARLLSPYGLALDRSGAIYVSDPKDARIRKISDGIITTIAGSGLPGQSPDGGPPVLAGGAGVLAVDPAGSLYFTAGNIIRQIASDGTVHTIAGSAPGFSGDNGPAVLAKLSSPAGMVFDSHGDLYIADTNNHRIRRIDAATRMISTIAGTGTATYGGDHGPATAAALSRPSQLAFDRQGNLYIADTGNNRVRMISTDGTIVTVAGNGILGDVGDRGHATAAQLIQPVGIAIDPAGNLYIAPLFGLRIRKVDAATHTITAIAGMHAAGFRGDGGIATSAMINSPRTLAADSLGNIYFTDSRNGRVRKLTPVQGMRR